MVWILYIWWLLWKCTSQLSLTCSQQLLMPQFICLLQLQAWDFCLPTSSARLYFRGRAAKNIAFFYLTPLQVTSPPWLGRTYSCSLSSKVDMENLHPVRSCCLLTLLNFGALLKPYPHLWAVSWASISCCPSDVWNSGVLHTRLLLSVFHDPQTVPYCGNKFLATFWCLKILLWGNCLWVSLGCHNHHMPFSPCLLLNRALHFPHSPPIISPRVGTLRSNPSWPSH